MAERTTAGDDVRANVLGIGISAIDMPTALARVDEAIRLRRKGYVCVTGVHGVMEAQEDPSLRAVFNNSFMTTPDGVPMVWVGRAQGHADMRRVYGPELMLKVVAQGVDRGYRHFLFGGNEGIAGDLQREMERRFPGARFVGTCTPPFRPLNDDETAALVAQVREAKPDIIWVGLSTPKQDRFMSAFLPKLDTTLMFGVGAAFDIHTGHIAEPPQWVMQAGLQWLHRLIQEPRRLWFRYLYYNPKFIWGVLLQFAGLRRQPLPAK